MVPIALKELTMAMLMMLSCAFSGGDTEKFEITIMENNRKEISIPVVYTNGSYVVYNNKKEVEISITLKDGKFVFDANGKKEEVDAKTITPSILKGNGKETMKIDGVKVLFLNTEGVKTIIPADADKWVIIKKG